MDKVEMQYTEEQKAEIISKLRAVCVAQAELWDVLYEIENEHEVEIEMDLHLVGELAGDCNVPPSFSDLPDDVVWESFLAHSSAKR